MPTPSVTAAAQAEINRIIAHVEETSPEIPMKMMCPSIGWQVDLKTGSIDDGSPVLGVSAISAIEPAFLFQSGAFRLAYNLSDEVMEIVKEKTLEFDGKKFLFV